MAGAPAGTRKQAAAAAVVYLGLTLVVAVVFVRTPLAPLVGGGDTNQFEYAGVHLVDHLRFVPWPRMEIFSNDVFYPYGVKHVFETWALERDYLVGTLWQVLGPGPWIKWHWLAGLFIGAMGTYLLARRVVGFWQAIAFGFLAAFFNFYLFLKYPDHICYAACHWATLAVLVDHLVVRGAVLERRLPLGLLSLRALLTVLCLGHDLAYTAAASLLSLLVHAAWLAGWFVVRWFVDRSARAELRSMIVQPFSELGRPSAGVVAMGLLTVAAGFLYVPLAAQFARESTNFPHQADQQMLQDLRSIVLQPVHLARIALPYLPGWNPRQPHVAFRDSPEQPGMGSVGWTLLIIAGIGLVRQPRRWAICGPTILLLVLFLTFSYQFQLLKLLPFMQFTRICGRATSLYPAILLACGLSWTWARPRSALGLLGTLLLVTLAGVEFVVGHQLSGEMARRPTVDREFYDFMRTVRQAPGEAVLDWPFCVTGGSGNWGTLNAYYATDATSSTYRRFHGKKCLGHYFGRLLPTMVRPYNEAGWDQLLMPARRSVHEPNHQLQPFDATQWAFFTEFYERNDFCGLMLHVDRLARGDEQEFVRRFGEPTARMTLPWAGRVVFIPKRPELAARVDRAAGRRLKLPTAHVWQYNGTWCLADGDWPGAIESFEQALALEPKRVEALLGIAAAYQGLGDQAKAAEFQRRAEQVAAEGAGATGNRGQR